MTDSVAAARNLSKRRGAGKRAEETRREEGEEEDGRRKRRWREEPSEKSKMTCQTAFDESMWCAGPELLHITHLLTAAWQYEVVSYIIVTERVS